MEPETSKVRETAKRKCLTIQEKLKIIQRLDAGETHTSIGKLFGVARGTVSGISKCRQSILHRHKIHQVKPVLKQRKRFFALEDSLLEKVLFSWYTQNKESGISVSGTLLKEHALKISRSMQNNTEFRASNGWLHNFKTRYGMRLTLSAGDVLGDKNDCDEYGKEIRDFMEAEGFDLDHVYNADETGLHWKEFPNPTTQIDNAGRISEINKAKTRVTLMMCTNASGNHQLPLLMVGSDQWPSCYKDIDDLPVLYTYSENGWMNKTTFLEWYNGVFLPSITSKITRKDEKFLLLLDLAHCHLSEAELNRINACCTVRYIPPNVKSGVQPMEQGIREAVKRNYRTTYLRELLFYNSDAQDKYEKFYDEWNLLRCGQALATTWESISPNLLRNAWINLLGGISENVEDFSIVECARLATSALEVTVSTVEINKWLDCDKHDQGWEVQTIKQITDDLINGPMDAQKDEITEQHNNDREQVVKQENTDNPIEEMFLETFDEVKIFKKEVEDEVDNTMAGPVIEDTKEMQEEETDHVERKLFVDSLRPTVTAETAFRAAGQLYAWMTSRWDIPSEDLITMGKFRDLAEKAYAEEKLRL